MLFTASGAEAGRSTAMRRATALVEECVIVACESGVFQASGPQGNAVSRAGMSSCTRMPTTAF